MQAAEPLKKALRSLGHPVARIQYQGKAPTYFTFQFIVGIPKGFADDDNTATETTWRVDLYSKTDYTALAPKLIGALKGAGFYGITTEGEQYEKETGLFHVSFNVKYLEE